MTHRKLQAPLHVAIIGYGRFGKFVAESLAPSEQVKIVAAVDPTISPGDVSAGVRVLTSADEVWHDKTINAVHIATTPDLHAKLALTALAAGKHVVIEKPLSLTPTQGQEVIAAARQQRRVVAVNYIMRHNPILAATRQLIAATLFGRLHWLQLENIATKVVPPDHWFWNMHQSGGILLEHGVHFFDAAAWMLETSITDVSGTVFMRDGKNTESRATVCYANGTVGDFYHAFITDRSIERTRWLLVWEHAQLEINGWIPLAAHLTTTSTHSSDFLETLGFAIDKENSLLTGRLTLREDKRTTYATAVRAVWEDVAQAATTGQPPLTDAAAGFTSLETAWRASRHTYVAGSKAT